MNFDQSYAVLDRINARLIAAWMSRKTLPGLRAEYPFTSTQMLDMHFAITAAMRELPRPAQEGRSMTIAKFLALRARPQTTWPVEVIQRLAQERGISATEALRQLRTRSQILHEEAMRCAPLINSSLAAHQPRPWQLNDAQCQYLLTIAQEALDALSA